MLRGASEAPFDFHLGPGACAVRQARLPGRRRHDFFLWRDAASQWSFRLRRRVTGGLARETPVRCRFRFSLGVLSGETWLGDARSSQ
jgi:hypothetical protein